MGNATACCKSKLIGTSKRAIVNDKKRHRAAARLLFFLLCCFGASNQAFSQDLFGYEQKLRSGNVEEKREALFQIRNLRSAEASRTALPALTDKTPIVRATAASSVIFLPPPEASAALMPLLNDKDAFVRREGAFALGEVGDASAGPHLIATLTGDKDPEVRMAAAAALGKVGDPSAVTSLLKQLDHRPTEDNEMLRRAVARSIGQIAEKMRSGKVTTITPQNFLPEKYKDLGSKPTPDLLSHFRDAVKRLTNILNSSAEADDTRREAAFALGAIGDRSAEPTLRRYTSSSDPYLAEICREALMKLKASE